MSNFTPNKNWTRKGTTIWELRPKSLLAPYVQVFENTRRKFTAELPVYNWFGKERKTLEKAQEDAEDMLHTIMVSIEDLLCDK